MRFYSPHDIIIFQVMHRKSEEERVDFFFLIERWQCEITNHEQPKCDKLGWFALNLLPDNVIPFLKKAQENYQNGIVYC